MAKVIKSYPKKTSKGRYLNQFKGTTGEWLDIGHYSYWKWTAYLKMMLTPKDEFEQRIVDLHSDED